MNLRYVHKQIIVFIVMMQLTGVISRGQDPFFQVVPLGAEISNSSLTSMIQDQQGFLLLATSSGLFRWDGQAFFSIRLTDTLPEPDIRSLFQHPDGRVFAGTEDGRLIVTNGNSQSALFVNSQSPITSIISAGEEICLSTYGSGILFLTNDDTIRLTSE